jgi:hypothetical protein
MLVKILIIVNRDRLELFRGLGGKMDNLLWPFGIFALLAVFGLLLDNYQTNKQKKDF